MNTFEPVEETSVDQGKDGEIMKTEQLVMVYNLLRMTMMMMLFKTFLFRSIGRPWPFACHTPRVSPSALNLYPEIIS